MGYKKITGIYKITNIINKKCYIGSALSIYRRMNDHKNRLNKNYHFNSHLQNAWNKYGEKNFIFEVLEECDEKLLVNREEFWIRKLNANDKLFGYNKRIDCSTNRGIKASEETKEKLRKSHLGHKRSKEANDKIIASQKKRVCQITLSGKLKKIYDSLIEAEEKTGIGRTSISAACRKKISHAGCFYWCFEKELESFIPPEIPKRTGGWINGIREKRK